MPASFPSATKSFTTKTAGQSIASAHVNDIQDEVTAIEGNLRGGSTGQVYVGGGTPGFASTIALHRVESSQLSVSGASTLGTIQAGNSTVGALTAGASTLATLQVGNSTITGNLSVSGTITNVGIPALIRASTFATASTGIVDLSTFTVTTPTQLDTLRIEINFQAVSKDCNNIRLRNKTDGVTVIDLNDQAGAGDLPAGRRVFGVAHVSQAASADTAIDSMFRAQTSAPGSISVGGAATFTTAWTGTIEYAIQGAVSTTAGNVRGIVRVFKQPGQ